MRWKAESRLGEGRAAVTELNDQSTLCEQQAIFQLLALVLVLCSSAEAATSAERGMGGVGMLRGGWCLPIAQGAPSVLAMQAWQALAQRLLDSVSQTAWHIIHTLSVYYQLHRWSQRQSAPAKGRIAYKQVRGKVTPHVCVWLEDVKVLAWWGKMDS